MVATYMDNCGNFKASICARARLRGRIAFLDTEPTQALLGLMVIRNNRTNQMAFAGEVSFTFPIYQLPTVRYWPTVAITGNGELGFDSGDGA